MSLPDPDFLKKSYFPGLISMVILPIACIAYLYFYQAKYMMPVFWFNKSGIERLNTHFRQKTDFEKFRLYTNLYLTGDSRHDDIELKKLKVLADELVSKADLKNGIRIVLTNKTLYRDLVTSLDICVNHKDLGFIPYNDNILLFKFDNVNSISSARTIDHSALLPPDGNKLRFFGGSQKEFPDYSHIISENIDSFWPCLIPLCGMIFFWRKRNKTYWNIN